MDQGVVHNMYCNVSQRFADQAELLKMLSEPFASIISVFSQKQILE